ncbi:MAG: sigma-70 family RNA polymerase sigma factor [Pirellulales bacterium]
MHTQYQTSVMRELRDQQVRFAPRHKKLDQMNRAERLIGEIESGRQYTYEYLCFRITDYRPDASRNSPISGVDLKHDLRLFVEDVSESVNIKAEEAGEPVHTVEDLSKMFNVSTKTIQRWRDQGLVSRRFLFGSRKRVGFLRSSVERFVARHQRQVERGERFTQMTDEEREKMIERARRLAQAGACPAEVSRRLARQFGRSLEAVRYTLWQYDAAHPERAIFPDRQTWLRPEEREQIYQRYLRGESVESLARQMGRTRSSIYRIVNEMRARRIAELPLDYIPNAEFTRKGAEARILAPLPAAEGDDGRKSRPPAGLPPYLASLYDVPLLTREQEAHLFRQFNYLKFRAQELRTELDSERPRGSVMDEIERLYGQAVEVKNRLVQANLRLVVSIAKRHVTPTEDFFSLVSDGNMSLIRAVEKFDYGRGNKFSTYATWAIMKNFARSIPEEVRQRDRFRTSQEEMFQVAEDVRVDQWERERAQGALEQQISRILTRLDDREQKIIVSRFGLNNDNEPLTLQEVGEEIGVTKERVRQLEARALSKLRQAARDEKLELPE